MEKHELAFEDYKNGMKQKEIAKNTIQLLILLSHGAVAMNGQKRRKRVHTKIKVCTPKKNAKK